LRKLKAANYELEASGAILLNKVSTFARIQEHLITCFYLIAIHVKSLLKVSRTFSGLAKRNALQGSPLSWIVQGLWNFLIYDLPSDIGWNGNLCLELS
jgi:hypothetical protein